MLSVITCLFSGDGVGVLFLTVSEEKLQWEVIPYLLTFEVDKNQKMVNS